MTAPAMTRGSAYEVLYSRLETRGPATRNIATPMPMPVSTRAPGRGRRSLWRPLPDDEVSRHLLARAVPRDPRLISGASSRAVQAAIMANAAAVIVAHNHPSGDPTPSPDDIA